MDWIDVRMRALSTSVSGLQSSFSYSSQLFVVALCCFCRLASVLYTVVPLFCVSYFVLLPLYLVVCIFMENRMSSLKKSMETNILYRVSFLANFRE